MKFFGVKKFSFLNFDYKNGCKNEFQNDNEKSCNWFRNRVFHKIFFKAVCPCNADSGGVKFRLTVLTWNIKRTDGRQKSKPFRKSGLSPGRLRYKSRKNREWPNKTVPGAKRSRRRFALPNLTAACRRSTQKRRVPASGGVSVRHDIFFGYRRIHSFIWKIKTERYMSDVEWLIYVIWQYNWGFWCLQSWNNRWCLYACIDRVQ